MGHTFIKSDKWIDALLRLRRCHALEMENFRIDEIYLLKEFNQKFRVHLAALAYPKEKAKLISQYTTELISLNREKKLREQALRRRHSETIYNLMQSKSILGDEG